MRKEAKRIAKLMLEHGLSLDSAQDYIAEKYPENFVLLCRYLNEELKRN